MSFNEILYLLLVAGSKRGTNIVNLARGKEIILPVKIIPIVTPVTVPTIPTIPTITTPTIPTITTPLNIKGLEDAGIVAKVIIPNQVQVIPNLVTGLPIRSFEGTPTTLTTIQDPSIIPSLIPVWIPPSTTQVQPSTVDFALGGVLGGAELKSATSLEELSANITKQAFELGYIDTDLGVNTLNIDSHYTLPPSGLSGVENVE